MDTCVIYARVSTKEQQDEGYSIPAQLKAIRGFCAEQGLTPVAEFVEAESAGRAGRKQFEAMLRFLVAHPDTRVVVAHKLDRLYRNFADQLALEEGLGARARYVMGDMPDTPQGELLRDVQLSVAKYYLGNLSEEVRKGMAEKVSEGVGLTERRSATSTTGRLGLSSPTPCALPWSRGPSSATPRASCPSNSSAPSSTTGACASGRARSCPFRLCIMSWAIRCTRGVSVRRASSTLVRTCPSSSR